MNGEQSPEITVVLADDHTLFLEGVREMLATDPRIRVIGEAADGDAATRLVIEQRPDVLLLDVEMRGPGASSIIRTLRTDCPEVQVIVLTMHDAADLVQDLLNCGAAAYLVKSIRRDELIAAIVSAASRPDSVLVSVSRETIHSLDGGRGAQPKIVLTPREAQVLQLIADAFNNAEAAASLGVSEATVKRHLTNIYAKLNAVSRVDAIKKGKAENLIRPE